MGMPGTMRELLDRGGVILAANARAERALHLRYAEARQAERASVWATPQIFDLHSWLAEQWKLLLLGGSEDRLLLNDLQEHALWERIIEPRIAGISLVEPASMATLAQEAYALLSTYDQLARLNDAMWLPEPSSEPEIFRAWARSFQQECTRHRWLPRSELIHAIAHGLRWGMLEPPREIGWIGFDRATPAEEELRAALVSRGTEHHTLDWQIEPSQPPRLYAAQSEKQETEACAAWVRDRLASRPGTRIGILLPDLGSRRAQLERDLFRLLSPQQFAITAGGAPALRFEFSLGQPLVEVPLVHAALLLLRWLKGPLLQQEISWLLLSSTLGAGQGEDAREALANLDKRLRNEGCPPPEMSLESFLHRPQPGSPAAHALSRDLGAMLQQHRRGARTVTAGEWVRHASLLLRAARWGERAQASSLLFQAREAWERLLDQLASLDFQSRAMNYDSFLTTLERAAHEAIFAPESADAPVQVMGAYAASGQSFDAVWFLGATDTAWPLSGRPNPLLPAALQREHGMPHASPADDTALAHRTMARIAASTAEMVYSYARISGEAMQQPSPLVSHFAPATVTIAADIPPLITLETANDDRWVPLNGAVASGGQMLLKRQANCPFQSFVFHRLNVRELSIAGRGLSPADRGNLLHRAMQGIWSKDIGSHQHLLSHADLKHALAADTLRPLVAAHTAAAMRSLHLEQADAWQRAYLRAEEERTVNLILEWLEFESQRQPFEVVAVEEKINIAVGELTLHVRADRIDDVPGGRLLLDYKTGKVSTASWEGPRPEEPQLPLYAAFGNTENLVGAVFAQTRPREVSFQGCIADTRASLFATSPNKKALITKSFTPALVEEWRDTLIGLSAGFVRGEAQIDPRAYPASCQYCELGGLCRVVETRALDSAEETAEEEEAG